MNMCKNEKFVRDDTTYATEVAEPVRRKRAESYRSVTEQPGRTCVRRLLSLQKPTLNVFQISNFGVLL